MLREYPTEKEKNKKTTSMDVCALQQLLVATAAGCRYSLRPLFDTRGIQLHIRPYHDIDCGGEACLCVCTP